MPIKTITATKGEIYTRRVQVKNTGRFIVIAEGEKRTANLNERFDVERIALTRKEIAKLAKLYPVEVSDQTNREAARDMKADTASEGSL